MPRKAARPWSFTFTDVQPPLTIYERTDRQGDVYLRWAVGRSHARPKLKGLTSIRTADGKLDPELLAEALTLGLAQYREALKAKADNAAAESGALTLSAGFSRALSVPGGIYPSRTPSWFEARRSERRILGALGKDTSWASLRAPGIRRTWRWAAKRYLKSGKGGPGAAETDVKVLAKVANWLVEAGDLDRGLPLPRGWRQRLLQDWALITKDRSVLAGPKRPRYTQREMGALFENVHLAAPPLALLLTLGGEFRGGQVLRSTRADLVLDESGIGFGQFTVHGEGARKPGGVVMLDADQRAFAENVLREGYLADLEAALEAAAITDYPLFPALRGSATRVRLRAGLKAMNRSALQTLMGDYEATLGIPHVPGRLMHGLRRAFSDSLKALRVAPAVKDAAAGWTPGGGTREKVYEEADRTWERERAAAIRRQARRGRTERSRVPGPTERSGKDGPPSAHPDSAPSGSGARRGEE